jgi:uncharacterized protein (DUF58 family)
MEAGIREALAQGEKLGLRYALEVPQAAASGWSGSRSGRRAGSSIDFQDYREYQPGDDLRFIDWGIYARSDRLTIKLFREEVTPHLDVILDGSRSMNLEESAKPAAAAQLAALLAAAAANAQCTQAVWRSGEGFERLANDSLTPSAWDALAFDSKRTPEQAFEILPPRLRRLGIRVLISDLLWPADPLPFLRRLREGAASLFVIQVLAREDTAPPEQGSLRAVDSETGEENEISVDATVCKQYLANLALLQQTWFDACRQCGAQMVTLVAEELKSSVRELEAIHLLAPA